MCLYACTHVCLRDCLFACLSEHSGRIFWTKCLLNRNQANTKCVGQFNFSPSRIHGIGCFRSVCASVCPSASFTSSLNMDGMGRRINGQMIFDFVLRRRSMIKQGQCINPIQYASRGLQLQRLMVLSHING